MTVCESQATWRTQLQVQSLDAPEGRGSAKMDKDAFCYFPIAGRCAPVLSPTTSVHYLLSGGLPLPPPQTLPRGELHPPGGGGGEDAPRRRAKLARARAAATPGRESIMDRGSIMGHSPAAQVSQYISSQVNATTTLQRRAGGTHVG